MRIAYKLMANAPPPPKHMHSDHPFSLPCSPHLVDKVAQLDLLKVARSCSARHDRFPPSHIARAQVVGCLEVVRVMTIVAEEERLDDRLVDYGGHDRDPRSVWLSRRLIHYQFRLFVSPARKEYY